MRADLDARKADQAIQAETGIKGAVDPNGSEHLVACYRKIFLEGFVSLAGFEDAETAEKAWDAIFDFLPLLAILVGRACVTSQGPTLPES